MRTFLLIIVFLLPYRVFPQSNAFADSLNANLTYLAETERFNGTVLYAENNVIVYKKAFGVMDENGGTILTTTSTFNLASVTKQFTCAAIMILYDAGKLDFDDKVTRFIPNFPYDKITIRQLMQHTSGLPEYRGLYMDNRTPVDSLNNEKLLSLLIQYHPDLSFQPGSSWQYNNTGYAILALIIEQVSGLSYPDFIEKFIAEPSGLTHTYAYNIFSKEKPAYQTTGFRSDNDRLVTDDLIHSDGVFGGSNMYSDVEDLFKWDQFLHSPFLIKATTYQEALQETILNDGTKQPYGFGWRIEKPGELYWHTGTIGGFTSLICRDLIHNRTLIVLSNGGNALGRNMAKELFFGRSFEIPSTTLINHITVVDGTGAPARQADVRIEGDKIIAVGNLSAYPNEKVIDGMGKVLAPGFIDSHSHVDRDINNNPTALAAISQGITTIVIGQDGESDPIDSLKNWCKTIPKSVNIATYTGHASLRERVMGRDELFRPATQKEIDAMRELLIAEMKSGSFGLSTGLEYEEGFYSSFEELIQLAKTTAAYDGKYISHLRSEDIHFNEAIDEIIRIGEQANIPVQISHIKIALKDDWGTSTSILAKLEQARMSGVDITADCYPYDYWHSTIRVLFPNKDFERMDAATFATTHLFDPEKSIMVRFLPVPQYAGKSVSEIAKIRNESNEATLLYLVHAAEDYSIQHPDADYIESIMGKSMSDADVMPFLSWTHTNICSDGANGGHPRGYGAFPRFLYYYVIQHHLMSLEAAVNKMTALSAEHVGISNRGVLAPGYYADMVLFDPAEIKDNADINNAKALSDGIYMVWTNGQLVYQNKMATNQFPGVFLSK